MRLRRSTRLLVGEAGMTMMEIIVVLAVVGIMAAMLTPMVMNYLDDAKFSKAASDVQEIGKAVLKLSGDVRHFPLFTDGTKTSGTPDIELLRGPGNNPVDNTTSGQSWLSTSKVGDLQNHVVINGPGGTKYPTTSVFRWKGPYLERLTEDPWGNRYLVNIKNADPNDASPKVVWVLSAGPNGKIETDPTPLADSGPVPGGDDIVVRVR